MPRSTLLIAGSIAIDQIATPNDNRKNIIGGSATYAMVAASHFADVSIVGIVGSDFPAAGHQLYRTYAKNLEDLYIANGKTFSWGGRYEKNWNDRVTLFTDLGVFAGFTPHLSARNVGVQTALLANIHPVLQKSVIEQSKAEVVILDTMNLWIEITRHELDEVLTMTDYLLINENESELLTGEKDIKAAAEKLIDYGIRQIIIKQGSNGAHYFNSNEHISVGVFPVERVVDPTGAGDVFAGAFAGTIASSGSCTDGLVYASALASVCVEGFGVEKLSNVNADDLQQRIEYLKGTLNL